MVFSKLFISFFTSIVLLTLSTTAMAESLVSNGSGGTRRGDYNYELWQTTDNHGYYLKIWQSQSYGNPEPSWITHHFESSREALDYFDCHYAGKSLQVCPS